jgi:hypothetical protein
MAGTIACQRSSAGNLAALPSHATSRLGQKRTLTRIQTMSALLPKADIAEHDWSARFVPQADISWPHRFGLIDIARVIEPDTLQFSPKITEKAELFRRRLSVGMVR